MQSLSIHCDLNEGTIGGMQIDVARPTDVNRIVGLVNDAYRGTSRAPGWTHETHLFTGARIDAAAVTGMIQPDRSTVLVMRQEDAIIASSGCNASMTESGICRCSLSTPLRDDLSLLTLIKPLA